MVHNKSRDQLRHIQENYPLKQKSGFTDLCFTQTTSTRHVETQYTTPSLVHRSPGDDRSKGICLTTPGVTKQTSEIKSL